MDSGAQWAVVCGVTQSQTRLNCAQGFLGRRTKERFPEEVNEASRSTGLSQGRGEG